MMRVLFCGGSPKAPSWLMRGVQISQQRDTWQAVNKPTQADINRADVIVVVKRFDPALCNLLRASKKPVVWDALDFWPQPQDYPVILPQNVTAALHMTKPFLRKLKPDHVICANKRMERDLADLINTRCIYHHARLDARHVELGQTFYYDGCEKHALRWLDVIRKAAAPHGWEVKCGAPRNGAGALLAVRDYNSGQWIAHRWKSNVKASNAIMHGLPLLGQPENGYMETLPDEWGVYFQTDCEAREVIGRFCNNPIIVRGREAPRYTVQKAADDYEAFLKEIS